ncbi:MAG TPA: cupin domain-containing protein [Patescibacteria group bacterium]|jgi:uncharacterized cupin superfamily protein|nr:cupin domain-containing protein [Patescibacteria group bacterium]
MKIISEHDVTFVSKPEGVDVTYYLFNEYEIITNVQAPGTTQVWHHHDHIWETMLMIEGEMTAEWVEDGENKSQIIRAGDLVESERTSHTFSNNSGDPAKFVTFKQVLSGRNHQDVFKSDKILD